MSLPWNPCIRMYVGSYIRTVFILRKVRRYITENAAKAMYKLMIPPSFYYNGFLLISCTFEQKREMQKCPNNAIRTCLMYNRQDHISIARLHSKMKLDLLVWSNAGI